MKKPAILCRRCFRYRVHIDWVLVIMHPFSHCRWLNHDVKDYQ